MKTFLLCKFGVLGNGNIFLFFLCLKGAPDEFRFLKMSDSFGTLIVGSTEAYPRLPKTSTMETLVKIVASH